MADDETLAASANDIERLLDELQAMLPPIAYDRVVDIVQRVVTLYASGLSRTLSHARAAGADAGLDALLCEDELVASLLALHGMHPRSAEDRIRDALSAIAERLDGAMLELIALEPDGAVRIRATGTAAPQLAERMIRSAIEAAAPEITRLEIEGLAPRQAEDRLGQIRRHPRQAQR